MIDSSSSLSAPSRSVKSEGEFTRYKRYGAGLMYISNGIIPIVVFGIKGITV